MENELIVIRKSELIELIREVVREEIEKAILPLTVSEYLTTAEAAKLVKRSASWIRNLEKDFVINNYSDHRNALYKRDEVLKAVTDQMAKKDPALEKLKRIVRQ